MNLASVSVDLDPLSCYRAIHGIAESGAPSPDPTARFLEIFSDMGIPATFFVVGSTIDDPAVAATLWAAQQGGHELGNHTLTHPYALTRLSPEAQRAEVVGGEEALLAATGRRPVGFRAPGYTLGAELLTLLAGRGYRYDASVFPAAPYYVAKATVMAGLRLLGRPSRAVLDRPRVLLAPRRPYRPSLCEPYRADPAGGHPLMELPMAIAPWSRLPSSGPCSPTSR